MRSALISTKDLFCKINSKANIRVLDCTWHLPVPGTAKQRNAREEYHKEHIPGAQFFDIEECSDHSTPYEHMLPQAGQFEEYVGQLGINNDTHVTVYDNNEKFGMFSAQRVWWTFRVFGHQSVSVLNGGLPQWKKDGLPVTDEVIKVTPEKFKTSYNAHMVRSFEDIERNISEKKFQVIDARAKGRFDGTAAEPRPDIKPGHMKGAINVPFFSMLHPEEKKLLSQPELKQVFANAGVDLTKPLVASCGSGVSACILALAAYECGKEDVAIYDGSWLEFYLRAKDEHKEAVPK